jgi:hypothetical protein
MNKEYLTIEDAIEMSGMSARDYFSYMNGDLVPEEDILLELFVNSIEDEEALIRRLSA